jgi:hypothetical protein
MDRFSIFEDIEAGIWDDGLDALIEAAVARRKFVQDIKGAANKIDFTVGTRVRICGNISPKYLVGLTGTVSIQIPSRRGDLMVTLDYSRGRFYRGSTIGIPASCLERVV